MVTLATQSDTLVGTLGKANINNNAKEATTSQPVLVEKVQASAVNHSLLILTSCLAIIICCSMPIQSTEHLFPCYVLRYNLSPVSPQLCVTVALHGPCGPHKGLQHGSRCCYMIIYIFQASSSRVSNSAWVFGSRHQIYVHLCC